MESPNIATIPNLDEGLAGVIRRLNDIESNLHDGLFGENPRDEEDKEKVMIQTPSLSSLDYRLNEIRDIISTIETHTSKIHSSNKIAG